MEMIESESESVDSFSQSIRDILRTVVNQPNVVVKSQQIGENDVSEEEKIVFLENLYSKSPFVFLTRYGSFLTKDQLKMLEDTLNVHSDCNFIIQRLKTSLSEKTCKYTVKNRRYAAMLKLKDENVYFSEIEMMKRNPLLYDQLVGRFLSEEERVKRDNLDTQNITLLNVLMEGIDKKIVKDLLQKQIEEEECQMEESDGEDDVMEHQESEEAAEEANVIHRKWGEFTHGGDAVKHEKRAEAVPLVSATERSLLREEFVQEMYRSFLAGQDTDVNYVEIDNNAEYDCLMESRRDDEEKYFDSETPEDASDGQPVNENATEDGGSEDELDVFMKHLSHHPSLEQKQVL